MKKERPDIAIVAPVYNEAEGIVNVIDSWVKVLESGISKKIWKNYEIVICDDGSTDNTSEIIESRMHRNSSIKLIRNLKNLGAGSSLNKAIRNSTGEYLALMDTDGQFNPIEIIEMYEKTKKYNFVCGIRTKNSNMTHDFASRLSTGYANFLFGSKVKDFNCQLKLVPGDFMRSQNLRATRMNYSGEITYLILHSKLSTLWMEIDHKERVSGKSKTKLIKDGAARFLFLTYLGLENFLSNRKVIDLENAHLESARK